MIREFAALPSTPTIIICKAPKAFTSSWGINDNTINTQINPIIQTIADRGVNLIVVDLYALFKDRPDLMPDGIHPNKNGATLMAQTFRTILLSNPPNNRSNAAAATVAASGRIFTESISTEVEINLVNIYPVPSEDKIIIDLKSTDVQSLQLRAADGSIKWSHEPRDAQSVTLSKEQVGSGVFLLTVKTAKNAVTKKVIFK